MRSIFFRSVRPATPEHVAPQESGADARRRRRKHSKGAAELTGAVDGARRGERSPRGTRSPRRRRHEEVLFESYLFSTTSSSRRFFARPSSESLEAIGFSGPLPAVVIRESATPSAARRFFTEAARSSDSFLLAAGSPVLSVYPSRSTDTAGYAFRMAARVSTVGRDSGVSAVELLSKLRLSKTNRFGTVVSLVLASHVARLKLNAPSGTEILKPPGSWSSASLVVATRVASRTGARHDM